MRALSILFVCFVLIACQHTIPTVSGNNGTPADPTTLAGIQQNILTPRCVNQGCHPGGGAPMSLASGQSFRSLVGVVSSSYGIPRIAPGDTANSALYLKILNPPRLPGRMPAGGNPLSQTDVRNIATWILQGAQNN